MAEQTNMSAKILVVDDEPNVLRMVSYTLQAEGYEVVVAQNGAEALSQSPNRGARFNSSWMLCCQT